VDVLTLLISLAEGVGIRFPARNSDRIPLRTGFLCVSGLQLSSTQGTI